MTFLSLSSIFIWQADNQSASYIDAQGTLNRPLEYNHSRRISLYWLDRTIQHRLL